MNVPYGSRPLVSRRFAIGAIGCGALAGAVAGKEVTAALSRATAVEPAKSSSDYTVARWTAERGPHYQIARRGSGDVYPENSMESFRAMLGEGARCLEVSVRMTSDRRLICIHDPTYGRTTTLRGPVAGLPSTVLRTAAIRQPQLGPAWVRPPLPRIPSLAEVLSVLGGRAVIALEASDDAAYPSMLAMAEQFGLRDRVIVKALHSSRRLRQAKEAGYPVLAYLRAEEEASVANVATLAAALDNSRDYLMIPAYAGDSLSYVADDTVVRAVATGVPTWVSPVHRRADVAHFLTKGVQGFVSASHSYTATSTAFATRDTWSSKAIAPGEMSRDPSDPSYAPQWTGNSDLELDRPKGQHFMTLGQLSPVRHARSEYRISFSAAFTVLPSDPYSAVALAFGHEDDSYYEYESGLGTGYHAILRPDGRLQVFRHRAGRRTSTQLGTTSQTGTLMEGQWVDLELSVTPTRITWRRTDAFGGTVTAVDRTIRGGYLHVGRSAPDGRLALRNLRVS